MGDTRDEEVVLWNAIKKMLRPEGRGEEVALATTCGNRFSFDGLSENVAIQKAGDVFQESVNIKGYPDV